MPSAIGQHAAIFEVLRLLEQCRHKSASSLLRNSSWETHMWPKPEARIGCMKLATRCACKKQQWQAHRVLARTSSNR